MHLSGPVNPRTGLPYPGAWRGNFKRGFGDILSPEATAAYNAEIQAAIPTIANPTPSVDGATTTFDMSTLTPLTLPTISPIDMSQLTPLPLPNLAYQQPNPAVTTQPAATVSPPATTAQPGTPEWLQALSVLGQTAVGVMQVQSQQAAIRAGIPGITGGITAGAPVGMTPGYLTAAQFAAMTPAQQLAWRTQYPTGTVLPVGAAAPSTSLADMLGLGSSSSMMPLLLMSGAGILVMIMLSKRSK